MKTRTARTIAQSIVANINSGRLPDKSALNMTVQQIQFGWAVDKETAQEIRWILTEMWR